MPPGGRRGRVVCTLRLARLVLPEFAPASQPDNDKRCLEQSGDTVGGSPECPVAFTKCARSEGGGAGIIGWRYWKRKRARPFGLALAEFSGPLRPEGPDKSFRWRRCSRPAGTSGPA